LVNIINLEAGELVKSILPLGKGSENQNLIMGTSDGTIKKTPLGEFANLRANGLIAIKLAKDAKLVTVFATSGKDFVLMLTKNGKAIKYDEKYVRPMGRNTTGVRGIKLESGDELIGMEVFPQKMEESPDKRRKIFREILTISEKGLGKRTAVELFPAQKRGGKGVKAAVLGSRTGSLASATMVTQEVDQVLINSKFGQVIRLPLKNIPQLGRATQGVILMRFTDKTDCVAAVTTLLKSGENDETL
jgi:DNA gyrase subunit A